MLYKVAGNTPCRRAAQTHPNKSTQILSQTAACQEPCSDTMAAQVSACRHQGCSLHQKKEDTHTDTSD